MSTVGYLARSSATCQRPEPTTPASTIKPWASYRP
jgi:hypothetical protein